MSEVVLSLALNYGIAIVAYLAIAGMIEALLSSVAFTGRGRPLPY
jgi:hypothetical protein